MRETHVHKKHPNPVTGQIYGKWTVIDATIVRLSDRSHVSCECSCGVRKMVDTSRLKCGNSKSCGLCGSRSSRRTDNEDTPRCDCPGKRVHPGSRLCVACRCMWHKYRMTVEQYKAIVDRQAGLCGICCAPMSPQKTVVDHCHLTGRVRGLLHSKCNQAIGMLGDDPHAAFGAGEFLSCWSNLSAQS